MIPAWWMHRVIRMASHTLLLMRHAKAAETPPGRRDHDRPLAEAGITEAVAAGEALTASGLVVDHVLCSSAARTRQTYTALNPGGEAEFTDQIYDAGSDTLLDLIQQQDERVGTLLLIGHAPGIPGLAEQLAGPESDPDARQTLATRFPTATLARFDVPDSWNDLRIARLTWLRLGH